MKSAIEQAFEQIEAVVTDGDAPVETRIVASGALHNLRQHIIALETTLRTVEWVTNDYGDTYCAWCEQASHAQDCPRIILLDDIDEPEWARGPFADLIRYHEKNGLPPYQNDIGFFDRDTQRWITWEEHRTHQEPTRIPIPEPTATLRAITDAQGNIVFVIEKMTDDERSIMFAPAREEPDGRNTR